VAVTVRPTPDFHPSAGDRVVLGVVWSLGWVTPGAIAGLAAPDRSQATVTKRLFRLRQEGLLRAQFLPQGPRHHRILLALTARAGRVDPGLADGWRPPPAAAWHSVDVGLALLAAARASLCPGVRVAGWQGEAELRAWAAPGEPYPDARVGWVSGPHRGRWWLEVDRGTEGRAAWRRKLARYQAVPDGDAVVALTTGEVRARHLAELAVDAGVPLLSCTLDAWVRGGDPAVYAAPQRRRVPLSEATVAPWRG
jgi:hypothetical protein